VEITLKGVNFSMQNSMKPSVSGQQDDLSDLLEYIENDPALQSPHEAQVIVTYSRMIRLVNQLRRGQTELSTTHGMQVGDFDILYLLQRSGARRLRITDISVVLRVTPGGISKRIDRLVAADLVRREPDPKDRRASIILLTEQGIVMANSARSRSRMRTLDVLEKQEWLQLDMLLKRMTDAHASGTRFVTSETLSKKRLKR
jgi:DNA-binding MarR family transcriptional regulator